MVFATAGENNRGQVGDNPTPADMFHALPIVTRCWFGATVVLTLSVNFNIIDPYHTVWIWENITSKMEIWRFLSAFCYAGPFKFPTMITMYMLVQFSKQYESGVPFNTGAGGGTADYAFCILLGAIGILVTYPLVLATGFQLMPLFCENLIYYVLYVWSKKNPTNQANIWGFPIQGIYLPFAYLAITVLMGNPSYQGMLHGMFIGHLYYFVADVLPTVYGKDFLHTPRFMIDYFGVGEYRAAPTPAAARPRTGGFGGNHSATTNTNNSNNNATANNDRPAGAHQWGAAGNRLGTN